VGSSSSAKKVARLAQRGKGKKIRSGGGSLFPAILAGVMIVGLVLVVYARASVPGLDANAEASIQRRAAFGVYVCDEFVSLPAPAATAFSEFGVTDLQDGVILMTSLPADGARGPRLGAFLDAFKVTLTDTELVIPASGDQPERRLVEGTDRCDDGDGLLSVKVWNPATDAGTGQTFITAFRDIRLPNDAMGFTIAFTPRNSEVPVPSSVAALEALIAGPQEPTG
jgi:hypothetical protein